MKKVVGAILFISVLMVTVVFTAYPDRAEAYLNTEYNYRFSANEYLSNGYQVQILGVGFQRDSALYIYTSTNSQVSVASYKNTKSKLESIKLVFTTGGYSIKGFLPFKTELITTCKTSTCALQNGNTINGINFSTSVSLKAELKFNDGQYTVYTSSIKKAQR